MAVQVGDAFVDLGVRDKAYKTKMSMAQKSLGKLAGAAKYAIGPLAGIGAVVGSMRAFAKQEQAVNGLEAALRANGDAVGLYSDKLQKAAASMQKVTTIGDETTLMLMTQLRNLGIHADALEETAKNAIGLAKALDLDSKSAARYTALAMQGEFTILQRYVPALREATTAAEKQAIVTDLMTKGWNQAKDEAKSATGRFEQLKNSLGDLGEAFVGVFAGDEIADGIGAVSLAISGLTKAVKALGKAINLPLKGIKQLAGLAGAASVGQTSITDAARIAVGQPTANGTGRVKKDVVGVGGDAGAGGGKGGGKGGGGGGGAEEEQAKIQQQAIDAAKRDEENAIRIRRRLRQKRIDDAFRAEIQAKKDAEAQMMEQAKSRRDAAIKVKEDLMRRGEGVLGKIAGRGGTSFTGFANAIKEAQQQTRKTPMIKLQEQANKLLDQVVKAQKEVVEAIKDVEALQVTA